MELPIAFDAITAEKDYRILVQKVGNDTNALTFIPYAYYYSNQDILKPLAVDNGSGEVFPSRQTVKWGQYQPFSRPLFIYVNSKATQEEPQPVVTQLHNESHFSSLIYDLFNLSSG